MRHPPHVSHLHQLLPGAVPAPAAGVRGPGATASGSTSATHPRDAAARTGGPVSRSGGGGGGTFVRRIRARRHARTTGP